MAAMKGQLGYQGADISAKIKYPQTGEDYQHLIEFLKDHYDGNLPVEYRKGQALRNYLNANGITTEEIKKIVKKD